MPSCSVVWIAGVPGTKTLAATSFQIEPHRSKVFERSLADSSFSRTRSEHELSSELYLRKREDLNIAG